MEKKSFQMRSAIIQNMKKRDCSYTECCILSSVQSKSSDAVLVLWTRAVEDTGMAGGTREFLTLQLGRVLHQRVPPLCSSVVFSPDQ